MAGVCTGPGPCDVHPLGVGKNWVTKVGGLPTYIRAIAHALVRSGHPESTAIATAIATVKRWAAGGGNVSPETRARAAKAVAEWEAKKAASHSLTAATAATIDLANGNLVYHWKHGWIPLDHVAALSKGHGNHKTAARIMAKHGITPPAGRHAAPHAGLSRLSVRGASYRGESGHLITGRDSQGRRVQVFAGDRASADKAVANIRAGRPAFDATAKPAPAAVPALPAGIHVEHTGDGTLVHGTSRGDGSADILKQHGFRWSSRLGAWYLPRGQHESTRRMKADAAHADLVAAGHKAAITKDAGSTVSAAERETQQRERSAARAERLTERAAKHDAEADRRHEAARTIMDRIPMGQPILIGHHSERGHRADLKRIDQNMSKMVESSAAARDATRRAEAAKRNAEHADTPLLRQRRIDRNEAEIRKIDKSLAQHEIAIKKPDAAARFGVRPSSDAHLEQLRAERARLADQVAHDKAQIEASGHVGIRAQDLQPGDVIHYRGRQHIVKKVNKTTVNVPTPYTWDDKVPINQITKHVRTESTAAIEKILEDPNASTAMKTAAREILAARAKKAARKGAALTAAPISTVDLAFTEQLHPRGAKGTAQGGKFVAKNSSGGGSTAKDTRDFQRRTGLKQSGRYDKATAAKVNALLNPQTGGGGSGGGKSKKSGKSKSKGNAKRKGAALTPKQTAAQKRTNAARTAVAVNKLTPAQRELFRAKHPTAPLGYRWNAAGLLVAVATNPQARRVRAILARP